jgi:dTMP kinase
MTDGFFLVFEGPEGSGKSTQIARLAERFAAAGADFVVTREPGGTPAADAIREVILDPALRVDAMTEFLLYAASRAQHVSEVIRPALAAGKLVISDRFSGASLAYQGYGRGLDLDFVTGLNHTVTAGLGPDLTLLLDIDAARGLERVASRGRKDRLEQADLSFHQRVREGFLAQAREEPNWVLVDADRSEEEVGEEIWQLIRRRIMGQEAGARGR